MSAAIGDIRVLGTLVEARGGDVGAFLPLGGPKPRKLLATPLVLSTRNEPVGVDRIIDVLLGGEAADRGAFDPRLRLGAAQAARRAVDESGDGSSCSGWSLGDVDLDRFVDLYEQGSKALEAGGPEHAVCLREGLALWRGSPSGLALSDGLADRSGALGTDSA